MRVVVTYYPRAVALVVLALVGRATPVLSQAVFPDQNGAALVGVAAVDARAISVTWLSMEADRDVFDRNLQSTFELGLRRDGVRVEDAAPNYLFCEIAVAQRGGMVAFSWSLSFYAYELAGVHRVLWQTGGIVTMGSAGFSAAEAGKACVDRFANEWLKWNPKR